MGQFTSSHFSHLFSTDLVDHPLLLLLVVVVVIVVEYLVTV